METIVRDYVLFNVLVKAKRVKNWFERLSPTESKNETRKNLLDISPYICSVARLADPARYVRDIINKCGTIQQHCAQTLWGFE